MTCYGFGSVGGSWLGGKLTDHFNFYPVALLSLFATGLAFIGLQWVHGFERFCAAVFFVSLVVDSFRPAMYVGLGQYAKSENRTRAVTLIRLAINLGFSAGPAIGGLIIFNWSYSGLFWVDGVTCIAAALLMLATLKPIKSKDDQNEDAKNVGRKPIQDKPFLMTMVASLFLAIPFFQYFSTIPLYYADAHQLDEFTIGLVMGMNGLLIFLFEMPLIKGFEEKRFPLFKILGYSALLIAISFVVLTINAHVIWVWIGMVFLTVGEMLNFPFINRFVYDRADKGKPGAFLGLYTITWSVAQIVSHNLGLNLIDALGYDRTWLIFAAMVFLSIVLLVLAERMVSKEAQAEQAS